MVRRKQHEAKTHEHAVLIESAAFLVDAQPHDNDVSINMGTHGESLSAGKNERSEETKSAPVKTVARFEDCE